MNTQRMFYKDFKLKRSTTQPTLQGCKPLFNRLHNEAGKRHIKMAYVCNLVSKEQEQDLLEKYCPPPLDDNVSVGTATKSAACALADSTGNDTGPVYLECDAMRALQSAPCLLESGRRHRTSKDWPGQGKLLEEESSQSQSVTRNRTEGAVTSGRGARATSAGGRTPKPTLTRSKTSVPRPTSVSGFREKVASVGSVEGALKEDFGGFWKRPVSGSASMAMRSVPGSGPPSSGSGREATIDRAQRSSAAAALGNPSTSGGANTESQRRKRSCWLEEKGWRLTRIPTA